MPIAIIIDNSLSMYKEINDMDALKTCPKEMACFLCEKIIDYVSIRDKYEFVSLVN